MGYGAPTPSKGGAGLGIAAIVLAAIALIGVAGANLGPIASARSAYRREIYSMLSRPSYGSYGSYGSHGSYGSYRSSYGSYGSSYGSSSAYYEARSQMKTGAFMVIATTIMTVVAFALALAGRASTPGKIAFVPIGIALLAHLGTWAMHANRLIGAL